MQSQPEEAHKYSEAKQFGGNPVAVESKKYAETTLSSESVAKKKTSQISKALTKILTAAVATIAAVVVILPIVTDDSTEVNFAEMSVTDTAVSYNIVLENWSGKEYDLVLYNDFTERTEKLASENFSGEQDGLKPNMTYTLAVKSGIKTLAETTVKTMRSEDMPVTQFNSVSRACACSVDGTFHFTMNFIDENGWWTDFKATLTDFSGNVSECVFTEDLHGLQTIEVTDSPLLGTSATFRITCTSYENNPDGETITLWESEEEI